MLEMLILSPTLNSIFFTDIGTIIPIRHGPIESYILRTLPTKINTYVLDPLPPSPPYSILSPSRGQSLRLILWGDWILFMLRPYLFAIRIHE